MQRILTLRSFPAFGNLAPHQVAVIAEHTTHRVFARGARIVQLGAPVSHVHFVLKGEVALRSADGTTLRVLGDRSVVGGLVAFNGDDAEYDAVALAETSTLAIGVNDALDIYEDNFPLLRSVLQTLGRETITARRAHRPTAGFSNVLAEPSRLPAPPLDFVERMAWIHKTLTFANRRMEGIAELAREATQVRVSGGTTLWREGDAADHMLLICDGVVQCESAEGHRFRLGPDDTVGSLESIAGTARWFEATIERDLVALRIDHEVFYDTLEDHFEMAVDVLNGITKGLLMFIQAPPATGPEDSAT